MNVKIDKDEWWPVLTIETSTDLSYGRDADIPEELVTRYNAVMVEFDKIQDELRKIYDAA